jgi:hypothetical protein
MSLLITPPLRISSVGSGLQPVIQGIYALAEYHHISMDTVLTTNINKLRVRYPDRFNAANAINRQLDVERKVLEGEDGTRE